MIVGVGVDLIDVRRIRAALENPRTGDRFRERVFTAGEIAYCRRRRTGHESFAARFAAKEAVMKALGRACSWCEIEVVRGADGPPIVRLHGATRARAEALGIARLILSISHTAEQAVAYVIAET